MPAEPVISWNYTACPPEDECANGHHTCDPLSETCVDQPDGFRCDCSTGYVLNGYGALGYRVIVNPTTSRCLGDAGVDASGLERFLAIVIIFH